MGPKAAAQNPVFRASSAVPVPFALLVAGSACVLAQAIMREEPAWVAVAVLLLAAIPRRVEVGREGVRIAWLGLARLVRYEDVRRAEPFGAEGVALTLADGETLRLARGEFDAASPRDVLERLWETVTLGAESGVGDNERAALARGRRDVAQWLADLRALASPGAQYRQGIVTHDRLLAIATNPAIAAELRGAAAVAYAFTGALDEATCDELRTIATLTVDATLREAFVRVSLASNERDLEAALRELA